MKKICSLLLAIALLVSLAACQAEAEAVTPVKSDMERMADNAMQAPATAPTEADGDASAALAALLGAPTRYQAEIVHTDERLSIVADASVHVPNVPAMPIARIRPIQFSQSVVDALFATFCGDTVMYDTTVSGFTRARLEKNIEMYQKRVEEKSGGEKESAQRMLDALEAELATIPTDLSQMVSDGMLQKRNLNTFKPNIGSYMGVYALELPNAAWGESNGKEFYVSNDMLTMDYADESVDWSEEIGANFSYTAPRERVTAASYNIIGSIIADETTVPAQAAGSLQTTPAEARALAEAAAAKLGCDLVSDMVLLEEKHYFTEDQPVGGETGAGLTVADGQESVPNDYCYVVTFGQSVNGVPCRSVFEALGNNAKTETGETPTWFYPVVECTVDDLGLQGFSWRAPFEMTELVTDHAALLHFSDISAIFARMMEEQSRESLSYDYLVKQEVRVTHVRLSLQRITEENAVDAGLLVPVWNFYGYCINTYDDGHAIDSSTHSERPQSLLTINALDGAVIDAYIGH